LNLCCVKSTKPFLAEVLGTFLLVLIGPGSAIADKAWDLGLGNYGVAGIFGLIVFLVICLIGNTSGAHINPIVTLAFLIKRNITFKRSLAFWTAQTIGALLAGLVFMAAFQPEIISYGCTLPKANILLVLGVEVIFTYILVLTILICAFAFKMPLWKLAVFVGLTVFVGAAIAGPISGGSMNPARTLGPATAAWQFDSLWIYLAGPIVGSLLAVCSYSVIQPYLRNFKSSSEH
jgi:MIP family channel proteins